MDNLRPDIQAAFARQQSALGNIDEARARLLQRALAPAGTRHNLMPRLAGGVATLVAAGSIAAAAVLIHGWVHPRSQTATNTIEQALSTGPAAALSSGSEPAFVWLIGDIVKAQSTNSGSYDVTGMTVRVVNWTGKLRYQFDLPKPAAQVPLEIQTISADGTRALLGDGTLLDQTGAVLGRIPALQIGKPQTAAHWSSDDRGLCAVFSNEPVAPPGPPRVKGQPNPSPTAPPPYTRPGADHSVTLKVFGLNGTVRTVATVGTGALSVPSGAFGDSASVLACNPSTDLAVVARYHDADINPADSQSTTNMTVSLWAIKLSTGEILYHQPETRMALGRAFFFGSQNGKLAVEFLWNSKVWGSETDVVLQIPSGSPVPVLDSEPSPDTPGLSADGTRILRRVVNLGGTQTVLELIDASDGRIIRQVTISGIVGASAVAQPGGSSFMVQVDRYLALVDGNGGITLLHPNVTLGLGGPDGVGLAFGLQG